MNWNKFANWAFGSVVAVLFGAFLIIYMLPEKTRWEIGRVFDRFINPDSTVSEHQAKREMEGREERVVEKEEKAIPEKPLGKLASPVGRLNTSVWLHNENNWVDGLKSLDDSREFISEVNPVWFQLGSSGKLNVNSGKVQDALDLIEVAGKNLKIRIVPVITNVSSKDTSTELLLATIDSVKNRKVLLDEIVKVANRKDFAGVDLDFEGPMGENFGLLADFLVQATEAVHKVGKTVAVDLEVSTDPGTVEAWKRIAKVADSVRVLVYSEHNQRTGPGPVASISWSKKFLESALTAIPKTKLSYGVPMFGYWWSGNTVLYSLMWNKIQSSFSTYGFTRNTDNVPRLSWDSSYQIWYEDGRSIQAKVKMAQALGITHFAFWRIGGEDPAIWKALN